VLFVIMDVDIELKGRLCGLQDKLNQREIEMDFPIKRIDDA
jgi:hypothetical protein